MVPRANRKREEKEMCIHCHTIVIDDGKGEWTHKGTNRYECKRGSGKFAEVMSDRH